MRIVIDCEDTVYFQFRELVGKGNMSSVVRSYIKSRIEESDGHDERKIRKKYEKIEEEYNLLKSKLSSMDAKRKEEEEKKMAQMEKERVKMAQIEHETIKANLHRMV